MHIEVLFEGFGEGIKNLALKKFADANNKKYGDKTYIGWNFTKFLVDRESTKIDENGIQMCALTDDDVEGLETDISTRKILSLIE